MGGGEDDARRGGNQDEGEVHRYLREERGVICQAKRYDMKEENKVDRFTLLLVATEKKIKLEEK